MLSALIEQWPSKVQSHEIIKLGLSGSEMANHVQCDGQGKSSHENRKALSPFYHKKYFW